MKWKLVEEEVLVEESRWGREGILLVEEKRMEDGGWVSDTEAALKIKEEELDLR